MKIEVRQLGAAGFTVPVLGLGVSGPHGLGLADTHGLVRQALNDGAALFDTAPFYGDSESRLGAALRGVPRAQFRVFTKAGKRRTRDGLQPDFSPSGVTAQVEQSLKTLGLDCVDGLLLHGPDAADGTPELKDALAGLVARGLVRAIGVCVRGQSSLPVLEWPELHFVQGPVWETVQGQGWAARALAKGLGFVGVEALRPAASDVRLPRSIADLWYLARGVHQKMKSPAPPVEHRSVSALLTQAIGQEGVSSVVITTTRFEHWAANLALIANQDA